MDHLRIASFHVLLLSHSLEQHLDNTCIYLISKAKCLPSIVLHQVSTPINYRVPAKVITIRVSVNTLRFKDQAVIVEYTIGGFTNLRKGSNKLFTVCMYKELLQDLFICATVF